MVIGREGSVLVRWKFRGSNIVFFFFFLGKRIVSRGWNGTEVKRNFEVEDM